MLSTSVYFSHYTLTTRLKPDLPNIIHKTQAAIDTRKINRTVQMIRGMIDYANEQDLGACFYS